MLLKLKQTQKMRRKELQRKDYIHLKRKYIFRLLALGSNSVFKAYELTRYKTISIITPQFESILKTGFKIR
jgi:hypothetical protein